MKAAVASWSDAEIVAGTIVGEASGELYGGKVAVAAVIRNRAMNPRWWGDGFRGVCLAPRQFSCWDDSFNRIAGQRRLVTAIWSVSLEIAEAMMAGKLPDVSLGSDHYYAWRTIALPNWARGKRPIIEVGGHRFYRLELSGAA